MITAQKFAVEKWNYEKPAILNVKPHFEDIFNVNALREMNSKQIIGVRINWGMEIYVSKQKFLDYLCLDDYFIHDIPNVTEDELWKMLAESYEKFKNDFNQKTSTIGAPFSTPHLAAYNITVQEYILPVLRS